MCHGDVMRLRKPPDKVREWEVVDASGESAPQKCWFRETAVDLAALLTSPDDPPGRFRVRRIRQEPKP